MGNEDTPTTCPACGAGMAVPEQGLTMTCPYCGHEAPVPDADDRRRAQERERTRTEAREEKRRREREAQERRERERRERKTEERRRAKEKARTSRRRRWAARIASIPGCLMSLVILAICLAGPAVGLWQSGMPQAFLAGPGAEAHDSVAAGATAVGYAQGVSAREAWVTAGGEHEQVVELRGDLCYALSVASGTPISGIRLVDPAGAELAASRELAFSHQLIACPEATGIHRLLVSLDKGHGRYTWSWSWKEVSAAKPAVKGGSSSSGSSSRPSADSSGGSRSSGSAKGGTRDAGPSRRNRK